MARMPHEKADARDAAQTQIKLEFRRYQRRILQMAEDHISVEYDRLIAAGLPFDHKAVAAAAVRSATDTYFGGVIEAGQDADAPATA